MNVELPIGDQTDIFAEHGGDIGPASAEAEHGGDIRNIQDAIQDKQLLRMICTF